MISIYKLSKLPSEYGKYESLASKATPFTSIVSTEAGRRRRRQNATVRIVSGIGK